MESTDTAIEVYQLRIWIRKISPQIWRRLLVRSDNTIAELHDISQIAFDWADDHLHRFLICGKPYGIGRIGGIIFDDNPHQVQLRDFHFRLKETWLYEYDLTDWWQHEIRLEQVLPFDPIKQYPVCIAGKRRGPLEDCGGPWAFMEVQDDHPQWKVLPEFAQLLLDHRDDLDDYQDELRRLAYWVARENFDRQAVNRRLAEYATRQREALMRIRIQILIESDQEGVPLHVEEVACFERQQLTPETLGLRLDEAKQVLAGVQQAMTAQQVEEYVEEQQRQCSHCQQPLAHKGHHQISMRTLFGKLTLSSPRLYTCSCQPHQKRSWSPVGLASVLWRDGQTPRSQPTRMSLRSAGTLPR